MSMNQVMTKYSGIMPLIDRLQKDPDIDFKFLYTSNIPDSVREFLKDYKPISVPYSFSKVSRDKEFDYVITIDPYYGPYCKGSGYNKWETKIIYKEYGVTGIDGSTYLYKRNIYQKAWLVITDTERTKKDIIEVTNRDPDSIIVGNPAFDYDLLNSSENKCVIWSPHCSIIDNGKSQSVTGGRFSTFLTYKDAFVKDIPQANKDKKFIYKLHPFLANSIIEAQKLGILDKSFSYEDWKREVLKNPNVRIAEDTENYYDIFKESSLMVSDSISFMAEYLLTGNPIIVLRDKTSSRYSEYTEEMIKSAQYESCSVEYLNKQIFYLSDSSGDLPYKRERRKMYLKSYKPYSISNSDYIINYLKDRR